LIGKKSKQGEKTMGDLNKSATKTNFKKANYETNLGIEFLPSLSGISNPDELKTVLSSLEEGVHSSDIPPVYALMLLNGIIHRSDVYKLINEENRAIGARVWSLLRMGGIQLEVPPIFDERGPKV
jgi:hypothetical protein